MKRWIPLTVVGLLLSGSLIWSEVTKPKALVSPEPILNLIADSERELTRLPVAFAPLPDREEIEAGKQFEQEYVNIFPVSDDDRAIESYVRKVGAVVSANAHRKLPYRFHYIPGLDFVNAFALPGGAIFIGGGLMSLMDTEDELASVLGHEIEHVDRYHCAERIQVEAVLHHSLVGALVGLPVQVFVAGYSKSQELEADREGAKLAVMAGYSPQGAIEMFQAFERFEPGTTRRPETPQAELSDVALQTLEGYFRSHPPNAQRIEQIQRMIAHDELPDRRTTKPLLVEYFFLTERAWRDLQAARSIQTVVSDAKLKREREIEQVKLYNNAIKLASQSLTLAPTQPRAMEIVAVSKVGLGDYTAATSIYHGLLPQFPQFADDLRVFIDTFAQEALDAEQYNQAIALAKSSLDLQPNQRNASKILAEAQLSKGDFQGAIETGRKLQTMYPDSAQELSAYAGQLAGTRLAHNRYEEAAGLAAASLALQPNQGGVLLILAKAQFALADFGSAAITYRKLLDPDNPDLELVRAYADALSADAKPDTPSAFETWMAGVKPPSPAVTTQLRIELAGLQLTSGDERLATSILAQAHLQDSGIAPELLGRLAWWYYRAHKYASCAAVLRDAIAQRPGDAGLQSTQAWNEIEQHQPEDAIRIFTAVPADPEWNSPAMGRAVALWQTQHGDDAVKVFDAAAKSLPEWRNERWVQAFYSASVAQSIAQISAESARRQSARR